MRSNYDGGRGRNFNDRGYGDRGDRSRQRGGDRGGRPGGDRGGRGGFGGGPKQPKNAQTRPGQEETLISNNFAISFGGADKAYVYKVNYGAAMQRGYQMRAAFMNGRADIEQIYGKVVRMRGQMLAFNEVREQQSVNTADNEGVPTVLTIDLEAEIDLHRIVSSKHMDLLADMISGATKDALTAAKFKQVGKVPRFFDTSTA